MKLLYYTFFFLLAFSCTSEKPKEIFVLKSAINITSINDVVFLNNQNFSGCLFNVYPNKKDTILIEHYINGLLSGTCKKWYLNKQLMESREYIMGRKNGKQIAYWENGNKRFEFVAKNDAYEGELKEWNFDGKLTHDAHFINGQEDGTQQMWYDNGKIRANYIIIKGRRYGLLGTKNCKNVSDSLLNTL